MATGTATAWKLQGTVVVACNCDYGCPCNFNAPPTHGNCEGGWTWQVSSGRYGELGLDDVVFSLFVKWPGAIHEGDGEGAVFIDERADEARRHAVMTLLRGEAGGPWGVLGWTWPTLHGPYAVPYEVELAGVNSRVTAGDAFLLESEPIRNPVSGAEAHPGAVLPEGLIFKQGDFGSSKVFRVAKGISYDHSGNYTAVAPFDYSGP